MPTESRILVANALHAVFGQGSRVPDTWDADLASEDAGFAQALLGACLRRWGTLQALARTRLSNPDRGIPLGTQVCLAIGLTQLAWLPGVSDHAAVNEAVELTGDRTLGFPPHRGLVNAILRAAARDRPALARQLDGLPAALDRSPFVERVLTEALAPSGQEARREELWLSLQVPPRPAFRQLKPGLPPEGLEPDPELPGALRLAPGAPFPRPWLEQGAGMVQDRSSQALMQFRREAPVRTIADLCAAPGGKTTALALRWPEALLWAVEQHPRRARRLQENLGARGLRAEVATADAVQWLAEHREPLDLILLDAPCTGSGTLRKHPELGWLGHTLDLDTLLAAQAALLQAAVERLAPGGLLVYSVCSWLPEEGLAQIQPHLAGRCRLVSAWPAPLEAAPGHFLPDPLTWEGEGFQGFAITRD